MHKLIETTSQNSAYVIAEIGHNHQGSVQLARKLITAAAEAGAHAVKFQKRCNRELFTREFYESPYNSENSFGPTYGSHREALELSLNDFKSLRQMSNEIGVDFISTAFDIPSLGNLLEMGVEIIKIASGDLQTHQLISNTVDAGAFVILSTGGANLQQVDSAAQIASKSRLGWGLLQCTSSYPAEWSELNLRVIETFRNRYPGATIGYSGHDNGIAMSLIAYTLGARIIEKHFTLNRTMKGTDHAFSLEPAGLRKLVRDLQRAREALGDGIKRIYPSEVAPILKMSKSLVAKYALDAGHTLRDADLAFKSPGGGIPPSELGSVVGRRLKQPKRQDEVIHVEDLE